MTRIRSPLEVGKRIGENLRGGMLALCLCGLACSPLTPPEEKAQEKRGDLYYTVFADGQTSGQLAHWPLAPGHRGFGSGADINVCYETNNFGRPGTPEASAMDAVAGSADERARVNFVDVVRHSIENSWGRAADINFYGWDRCPEIEPPGWVVLRITNSSTSGTCPVDSSGSPAVCPSACPALGSGCGCLASGPNPCMWCAGDGIAGHPCFTPRLTSQGCCGGSRSWLGYHGAGTPTYFGHVLGFQHEFERADWEFKDGNSSGTASGPTCSTDADCTGKAADVGSVCTLQVDSGLKYCRQPSNQGQALGVNADFHSVMAATYVNNCTGSTWDGTGNASPTRSLSMWDVIGAQAIYGVKPGGSIVGKNNLCATMTGSTILAEPCLGVNNDVFNNSLSGTTVFARQISATPTLLVGDLVVSLTRCMTNPGAALTPISSAACSSSGSQQFTLEHIHIHAMGNLCVAATARTTGAGLELRKCDDAPATNQCGGNTGAIASDTLDVWQLPEFSSTLKQSLKLNNSFCVSYPSGTAGAPLSLDVCRQDQANEGFVLTGNVIMAGGLCLTAADGLTSDVGTALILAPCSQASAVFQRFYLTSQVFAASFPVDTADSLAFSPLETTSSTDFTLPAQLWDYYWK